jgi:hypothetical protein
MAATNAQRQANSLLVHGYMNMALNAGIQGQPPNTSKTYRKPQRDFQDWCLRNKFDDGILVSEGKVVSWLQDEVLQRSLPPKGPRRGRRRPVGRPPQLEVAMGGPQQPTGPSPDSSEDEGDGEEAAPKALKV